ncbi:MAG: hypothetical protein ABI591_17745 [Kofleriaceae bacterium]
MRRLTMKTLSFACLSFAACASADLAAPDASPPISTIPTHITGTYDLMGQLDLQTLPEPATYVLSELASATDSPDDPARYLIDQMVAGMPEGTWKAIATGLAGYVAPYVETEIDRIAPRFAPGIRAISAGLNAIARHITTLERLSISADGTTTRALVGLQLANTPVEFAAGGAADSLALSRSVIDNTGTLAIASHHLSFPFGEMLRLGLDRAVIPPIDLSAGDLATALRDLVDCHQLGITFADHAGFGSASMYETACGAGMTALASKIYDRLAAIDLASSFELEVSGTAVGVDHDGDGTMDVITNGTWVGATNYAGTKGPLGLATFTGEKE